LDQAGEYTEYDPSYNTAIYGPYSAATNDYLKRELQYNSDLPYEILTGRVRPWDYGFLRSGSYDVHSQTLLGTDTKRYFRLFQSGYSLIANKKPTGIRFRQVFYCK